jgi:hypothetical protein
VGPGNQYDFASCFVGIAKKKVKGLVRPRRSDGLLATLGLRPWSASSPPQVKSYANLAERLSSHRAAIAVALVLLVSLGSLYAHARHYLPFLADDALISLRYANRLLEGNGLTWTDGHPVEGYSNLS